MTIEQIQEEIIEEFSAFDDWMGKYNLLIDLGRELPVLDPKFKTRDFLIEGCQSKVWLYPEFNGSTVSFKADSDALITKGIVALLIRVFSGRSPEEIISADLHFIDKIGLRQNLSPTRANGLLSMVRQIKLYAIAFKAKNTNK
ncbi:MAG TPA: SufE family protein [Bacteroidales bacterium]|jgi:cysteine desulfuration protein SufE|nr:SufE family protein [Bacteroidales bacterium]OQB62321.1 MAG: Cysteine desulfuration protein SufE [Bacteroidetes bacterium ADurb.Bin145]NMD02451.1 SufE family protein [Bacteroidales bacterium]HOU02525.1 SufE family protein [Bacteroidales bacterium]HQG62683.1 SufE family protein [Bacteroidales bacterium]